MTTSSKNSPLTTDPKWFIGRMSLNQLADRINDWATTKGWNEKQDSFGDICALFHTEISEAYEEWRKGINVGEVYYNTDKDGLEKPEGPGIELADLVIRVLHFAASRGLNLESLVEMKMEYNELRPYRHGGKRT